MLGGLVGPAHGGGLVAGPDGRAQGGVEVVGEAGVPGQLGGGPGCTAVGQRGGVLGVQPHPLARQQVVVDGLAEQRVPEGVAALAGDQDVHLDGLAERLLELAPRRGRRSRRAGRGRPCGRRRSRPAPPAGSGRRAGRGGPGGRPPGPSAGCRRTCPAAPTSSSTKNALPSARPTIVSSSRSERPDGASIGDQRAHVVVRQRAELDPLDAAQPGPLGDLAAERVPAVEVVGAVGGHHRDRAVERPGEQEAEQVAGRLVGPVAVLDDHEERGGLGGRLQQRVHGGEQVGAVDAAVGLAGVGGFFVGPHHPAARAEAGEGRVLVGDLGDELGQLGLEAAQHLGEREVGQRAVAEVEAVAGDDPPLGGDGEVAQLHQQPGLADARVPGEDGVVALARGPARRPTTTGRRATKRSPSARRLGPPGSDSAVPRRP